MGLFKVAAFVAFVLAAVGGLVPSVDWSLRTLIGLIAVGLACEVAAVTSVPHPPPSR